MRAVRFDDYGPVEVLQVTDVPRPEPAEGELLVRVRAAGINPGEISIREGLLHERWPATFPSGEGTDLAGTIEAAGPGVSGFAVGDPVIAFTHERASHAEYAVVKAEHATAKPRSVSWEVAGALSVAGATAWAAVRAVGPEEGETVVVSAAAGGVGSLAAQLAGRTGARVIGLAGEHNHDWLRAHGIEPVTYGEGVADRIRAAVPDGVDAFIDTSGQGYVALALELGVAPDRIDTIIDYAAAAEHPGVRTDGSMAGSSAAVLGELAGLLASGELELPIAGAYPLERVQDAYRELAQRHTRGKIVLIP